MPRLFLLLTLAAAPTAVTLEPLDVEAAPALGPYDTAAVMNDGDVSVGIFAPLRWGLTPTLELEIPPLVSVLAPSPTLRVRHAETADWTITGEYGLSWPTPLMSLARCFLFPSGDRSGQLGQTLIASLGYIATFPFGDTNALSVRMSLAFGLPLVRGNVQPLDSFLAPVEVLTAPVLRRYAARVAVSWDGAFSDAWRYRTTLAVHRIGEQPAELGQGSPWLVSWHVAVDWAVSACGRLTLGLMTWNLDNFRTVVRTRADGTAVRERVRSFEFYPTFDYIHTF